jgi:hypothetical protein
MRVVDWIEIAYDGVKWRIWVRTECIFGLRKSREHVYRLSKYKVSKEIPSTVVSRPSKWRARLIERVMTAVFGTYRDPNPAGEVYSGWCTLFFSVPPLTTHFLLLSESGWLSRYGDGLRARFPAVQDFSPQRPDRLWGPPSGYRGLFPPG